MNENQTSRTFQLFRKLGIIHDAEKYGQISIFGILTKTFQTIKTAYYFKKAYNPGLFHTRDFNYNRAKWWRKMGCHVGNNVSIGHSVGCDVGNTNLIFVEDDVIITNHCIILCHRRDMKGYRKGDNGTQLPYIYAPVTLKKGCQLGMGSIVMPGVTVGEGAIVGARSVVTKDIPAWTIAAGSPAKVIKQILERDENE